MASGTRAKTSMGVGRSFSSRRQ